MSERTVSPRGRLAADLALLLVTAIWGSTFALTKNAVTEYPVLPFLAIRFIIATAALAPIALYRCRIRLSDLLSGAVAGLFLFSGYTLQTWGLQHTSASKAGFITGLSVVLVPIFVAVLCRRFPSWQALAGTGLAVLGLGLLSLNADLTATHGDLLVLGCTVGFAGHITALGILSPGRDARVLALAQTATVAALSSLLVLLAGPFPAASQMVWGAAAFTGVAATALAFLIQTGAQRFTTASHTALILTAEPVFAGLFGVAFAGERLTARGWAGCAVILAGVILGALAQNAPSEAEPQTVPSQPS